MPARRGVRPARAGVMNGGAGSGPTGANAPGGDSAGMLRARAPGGPHVRRDHAAAMPREADSGPTEANAPREGRAGVMRARAAVRPAGPANRRECLRPPIRTGHGPDPAAASALPPGDGRTRRRGPAMRNAPGAHGDRSGEPTRRKPGGPIDGSMAARPPGPGTEPGVDVPTAPPPPPHHRATPGPAATAAGADRNATGDAGARVPEPRPGTRVNRAAGERGTPRTIRNAARTLPLPPARRLPATADQPSVRPGMPAGAADQEVAAEPGTRRVPAAAVSTSAPTDRPADVGIRAPDRPAIRNSCCGPARRRRRS